MLKAEPAMDRKKGAESLVEDERPAIEEGCKLGD
jgi:hypothetical protein